MIPPALAKVGQMELKEILDELKRNGHDVQDGPIADDDGLAPPAEHVRDDEHVKLALVRISRT
jgi:hypothetical protein